MGTVPWTVYAPTRRKQHWKPPHGVSWKKVEQKVKRLQMRIAKAAKQRRYRTMRSLQWILVHSYYARLLAIKRVTSNKGKATPGVDGVVWRTSLKKEQAVKQLKRRGYKAKPLRRVYIRKKSGKLRPLGIPTMHDRSMQALYALSLAPVSETWADRNSYGFRYGRCCADAHVQSYIALAGRNCSQWVLEADIASCFDEISHQWLLDNIPVDKKVLSSWLQAGFCDKGVLYPTLRGTPQGGIISPLLMNMTLDGLEHAARSSVPRRITGTTKSTGVNVIRYADDFIVTGKNKELLAERVLPAIKSFLAIRGLSVSAEKTKIVHIEQGFDFLGQHIRKYNGKFLITPTQDAVHGLQASVKSILKAHSGGDVWSMIRRLNQTIQGWCNYHRHSCSSQAFNTFDTWLFWTIKRWLHRRHPNKGRHWLMKKYYRYVRNNRWTFFAAKKDINGKYQYRDLIKASRIHIIRHVKVRAEANPFDPEWFDYFKERKGKKQSKNQDGRFVEEYGWLHEESCLKSA
jgi:RNA-directed DNA polymerase